MLGYCVHPIRYKACWDWVGRPMARPPVYSYYRIMKIQATQLYIRTRSTATACLRSERGAGMVEYALLVGLIAIVLVVAITFFAGELNDSFSSFGTAVDGTT